ncbi:MAG: hypothetical protein Q7U51_01150, partial [Methanoregula sp.]|nr:hypothetical protein [Methanoregula sp.]
EIGDLIAAKTVCKQYVQSFPDDLSMRYNLAVTNFALQNFEETDQFLQQTFSPKICGLEIGTGISRMYMERNQFRKALELAYDLRREFFDIPEAHENYISVFLNLEKSLPQFEDIQKVQVDSAVYFKNNDNGDEFVFVIESREDLSPRLREKSINDPFIEKIIGKEKGESIPIIGGKAENENIEITDILNKYVYAFRESFNDYNKNFPDSSAVKKIQIKSDSDEKITEESIKKMFELVHQNYDYKQNILNLYLEKKVPISAIAAKFKINSYDLFPQFSSSPDLGIFSFYGNNIDIIFASNQLAAGKKIILDFSSLFTIFLLKLEDLIIDTFGKPVITQSLLDELNSILINLQKPLNRSEHGYLTSKDGRIVMETISSEQIDAEAQKIRKLLEWIKINCDVVPCYPLLNLTQSEIEKYKFMGKVSLDSIYLSSDNAHILFTDDKILSSITKGECGSNCISIQDILCYLHSTGKISEEQHVNLLLQLFEMNYYYIQFSLLSDCRFSVS